MKRTKKVRRIDIRVTEEEFQEIQLRADFLQLSYTDLLVESTLKRKMPKGYNDFKKNTDMPIPGQMSLPL